MEMMRGWKLGFQSQKEELPRRSELVFCWDGMSLFLFCSKLILHVSELGFLLLFLCSAVRNIMGLGGLSLNRIVLNLEPMLRSWVSNLFLFEELAS